MFGHKRRLFLTASIAYSTGGNRVYLPVLGYTALNAWLQQ